MDAGGVGDPFVDVDVHVDEAGADHGAAGIDLAPRAHALDRRAGRQHAAVADGDVGDGVDIVGRIDHAAAAQQQIGAGEGRIGTSWLTLRYDNSCKIRTTSRVLRGSRSAVKRSNPAAPYG